MSLAADAPATRARASAVDARPGGGHAGSPLQAGAGQQPSDGWQDRQHPLFGQSPGPGTVAEGTKRDPVPGSIDDHASSIEHLFDQGKRTGTSATAASWPALGRAQPLAGRQRIHDRPPRAHRPPAAGVLLVDDRTSADHHRHARAHADERRRLSRRPRCLGPRSVTATPTATSRAALPAAWTNDALGTSAPEVDRPRSPLPTTRSASDATGSPCASPGAAPRTTDPRVRPGRANRGPSRPRGVRRQRWPDAHRPRRSSPRAHRSPIDTSAGLITSRYICRPGCPMTGRLEDRPGAAHITRQQSRLEPSDPPRRVESLGPLRMTAGRLCSCGRLQRLDVGRLDPPRRTDLAGRQHAEAHVAVRRHVMHAEFVRHLMQGAFPVPLIH